MNFKKIVKLFGGDKKEEVADKNTISKKEESTPSSSGESIVTDITVRTVDVFGDSKKLDLSDIRLKNKEQQDIVEAKDEYKAEDLEPAGYNDDAFESIEEGGSEKNTIMEDDKLEENIEEEEAIQSFDIFKEQTKEIETLESPPEEIIINIDNNKEETKEEVGEQEEPETPDDDYDIESLILDCAVNEEEVYQKEDVDEGEEFSFTSDSIGEHNEPIEAEMLHLAKIIGGRLSEESEEHQDTPVSIKTNENTIELIHQEAIKSIQSVFKREFEKKIKPLVDNQIERIKETLTHTAIYSSQIREDIIYPAIQEIIKEKINDSGELSKTVESLAVRLPDAVSKLEESMVEEVLSGRALSFLFSDRDRREIAFSERSGTLTLEDSALFVAVSNLDKKLSEVDELKDELKELISELKSNKPDLKGKKQKKKKKQGKKVKKDIVPAEKEADKVVPKKIIEKEEKSVFAHIKKKGSLSISSKPEVDLDGDDEIPF